MPHSYQDNNRSNITCYPILYKNNITPKEHDVNWSLKPLRNWSVLCMFYFESVKKYFQRNRFSGNMKIRNRTQTFIVLIELEICSVCDILLRERRI